MFVVMKGYFSDKFVAYWKTLWKEPFHLLTCDTLREWFWLNFVLKTENSET